MIISGGFSVLDGRLTRGKKDRGYVILCNSCGKPLTLRPWIENIYSPTEVYVDPCENCKTKHHDVEEFYKEEE